MLAAPGHGKGKYDANGGCVAVYIRRTCSIQASNLSPLPPPTVFSEIGRQHAPEYRDAQPVDSKDS